MEEEGGMLRLTSKEISHGGRIPRKFTQEAQGAVKDISPPLEWYGVPEATQSLVVIMEDPDVPDPANPIGVPWVHCVRSFVGPDTCRLSRDRRERRLNIPAYFCKPSYPSSLDNWLQEAGLPAGFTTKEIDSEEDGELGEIQEGVNDFKVPGYRGPNPPSGVHSYSIKLYALDTKLKVGRKPSRDKVLDAMSGHILDEAELVATYGKENYVTGRDTYIPRDAPHGVGPGHPEVKGGNPMGQLHR